MQLISSALRMAAMFLVLLVALCTVHVSAWTDLGHMAVVEIARRRLTPENLRKADAMSKDFADSGPFIKTPDMVQLSVWADDVKQCKQHAMSDWHFINIPYNPENVSIPDNFPPENNVVNRAKNMVTALSAGDASPRYNLNFAFVNLLHLVGDIHQPLHSTALFSEKYPNGDLGGNLLIVNALETKMKLHLLWDLMCQERPPLMERPLSKCAYYNLREFADDLMSSFQFSAALSFETDFDVMAQESHEFAVNTTYVDVYDGVTISQDYLYNCRRVAGSRVALAGYRLGNMLNTLLDGITVPQL